MTGRAWKGKVLLAVAYITPALALAIYLSFVLLDIHLPFWPNSEAEHLEQHIHEGSATPANAGVGAGIGAVAPYFELELEDGSTLTLTELLEQGRPTFLYFWATT